MKQKFFTFAVAICLAVLCMGFATAELYTRKQVKKAVDLAAKYHLTHRVGQPEPLQLGDLLYINVHINIGEEEQAGKKTPDSYKKGWRTLAARNPRLVHEAIKAYGPMAIRLWNKKLKRYNFDEGRYWNGQRSVVHQYKQLAQKMLFVRNFAPFENEKDWQEQEDKFPNDLMLLIIRAKKDFAVPERETLKQVILACDEFDEIIPNN